MITTQVGIPGGWELLAIILVIVLLFGAKKLPELARGSGQALRIFKAETKGMGDDEEQTSSEADTGTSAGPRELHSPDGGPTETERLRREHGDSTGA